MIKEIKIPTASDIKYLLVMKKLYSTENGVSSTDIAKALNISKPSIHNLMLMKTIYI